MQTPVHNKLYEELLGYCTEYLATTKAIDDMLSSMDIELGELTQANNELEHLISLEANELSEQQKLPMSRRVLIAGPTRMRWLLDGEGLPVFEKLDEQVALTYRRKLLQHYHPDKATGDREKFNMVNAAVATANVEVLGLLILGIGQDIEVEDLARYHGAAFRRLATLRAGFTFRVLCLSRSGNGARSQALVKDEVDKRTKLIRVAILNRNKAPYEQT